MIDKNALQNHIDSHDDMQMMGFDNYKFYVFTKLYDGPDAVHKHAAAFLGDDAIQTTYWSGYDMVVVYLNS